VNVDEKASKVTRIGDSQSESDRSRPLSLRDKLRQDFVAAHLSSVKGGKSAQGPLVVELDPTTICNLACHDCISGNLLNQGGFTNDRLLELAGEFATAGVKAVVLIGGGEPMAHPKFGEIVEALHATDIHVGVTTNGTLLGKFMRQSTLTKWLRVSVDAGSAEVFSEFRPHRSGRSQFDLVIGNMRAFAELKQGLLGYSFLVLSKFAGSGELVSTNASDIAQAAQLAKDIGCDYFEVKPAFDLMHYLQKQERRVSEITSEQLETARLLADENFQVIAPRTLDEALRGSEGQPKSYTSCPTTNLRTVVTPSGVYVCPYHRGNLQMKIGDAASTSFVEVWTSKRRQEVMKNLNPSKHCGFHCIRHESNIQLFEFESNGLPSAVPDYDRFI
jgi:MoaA/NifB/PqqE/SkfB family radical SAM enzyme